MRGGRRRYGAVALCVAIALSWSHSALSTVKPPAPTSASIADATATSKSAAKAVSESNSAAAAAAKGYGGDASGQTVSSVNESSYLAIQRSLPRAVGCFGPVDAGGGSGSGGGFFGITLLNKDCFAQEVSAGYEDHQIKARLECGSKFFRNAIGYTIRRSDRRAYCVDWMMERYELSVAHITRQIAKVEAEREYADLLTRVRTKVKECRARSEELTHELEVSKERTRRAEKEWIRCLAK